MIGHLHTHSYFSLLEGVPSPHDLVQAAAQAGSSFLALTDHNLLTGTVEFYQACKEAGVKPILGLEVDLACPERAKKYELPSRGPLVLLAMDTAGWSSLCRLSSALQLTSETAGSLACSFDLLSQNSAGVICLTGGLQSILTIWTAAGALDPAGQLLDVLKDIYPDRLYVELQNFRLADNNLNFNLSRLAREQKLPVVATHGVYYLEAAQAGLQKTLTSIRLIRDRSLLQQEQIPPAGSCLIPTSDLASRFRDFPAALAATEEIAGRCTLELSLGGHNYPLIPLPPGTTAIQVLRQKATAGARKLYGEMTPQIQNRLDYELDVIAGLGYEAIFLIVEDIFDFARRSGIPTSSRGSAASSLVAHCLGITTPDPIALNLYFERFLNPARTSPPDIDTDLCSRYRDDVIQHVFDTYGSNRVAMVATINRFRPRSAFSDVAKAYGMPPDQVRELSKNLPHHFFHVVQGGSEADDLKSLLNHNAGFHPPSENLQAIVEEAIALLDVPRHLSVHPGGIVISPGEMTDTLPVMHSGSKGIIITQMDLDAVEAMGLVKIDLLGIRGLTVLGDVSASIQSWEQRRYRNRLEVLEDIPLDDPETAETIACGRTIGCFQIESPGMRSTLKEIQAQTISDVIAALALYRPGPLKGGLRDAFVRRHQRIEPTEHVHPSLAPILDESYGVILYQEQVLRIAHDIGGFSLAESDLLRRAMSHFDPGKRMQEMKTRFITGANQRCQIPEETGERLWEMMASFAGYGFPKAHAASYALVAWRSAWCKTHFPAEFLASVMANWGGYYSQRVYMAEARRLGIKILPPNINHSRCQFSTAYPNGEPVLYMGLDQVKGLTGRTQSRILSLRPFRSFEDFVTRVDPRVQEVENLVKVGALCEFGYIPALLSRLGQGRWQAGQPSLFELSSATQPDDWPIEEKVAAQEELLGISVDIHPLELFKAKIAPFGVISTVQAADRLGDSVRVAGMRQTLHRSRTNRGETIAFLSFEDLEGMLDAVIFPSVYKRYRYVLQESINFVFEGKVTLDEDRSEPILSVEKIWPLK